MAVLSIKVFFIVVANGAMESKLKQSEDHYTYVNMDQMAWDLELGFWKPKGSIGDRYDKLLQCVIYIYLYSLLLGKICCVVLYSYSIGSFHRGHTCWILTIFMIVWGQNFLHTSLLQSLCTFANGPIFWKYTNSADQIRYQKAQSVFEVFAVCFPKF